MVNELDCAHVRELLDAYALGASDPADAKVIEEHVADCIRCWEDLSSSQATAALLALSVQIEQPPARLEERIMAAARRDQAPRPEKTPWWQRLRIAPWPATAAAFGAVSVVALGLSGAMQMQLNDVKDQNADLQTQVRAAAFNFQQTTALTNSQLAEQEAMFSILADDGHQEVAVKSSTTNGAEAYYTWSPAKKMGFVLCDGLPSLEPDEVYQLWFVVGGTTYALRPFISSNGKCQETMDLSFLREAPTGIGITVENAPGGGAKPSKPWTMYGHLGS